MLGRIFIELCAVPGFKKRMWRTWYEYLAGSQRAPDWTFMNYGYVPAPGTGRDLCASDEADREFIQLYDYVAGAVDLKDHTVLEVGSGRGGGASFIKRYLGPRHVTGVDLSQKAVEFSRERHRVDGLQFKLGDAENLPFNDNEFDAVINVESSHCYPSFEKFLSEVRRVLRPDGFFLYADFRDRRSLQSWRKALEAAPFEVVRATDITGNVVAALERKNESKLDLINRLVPGFLRPSFRDFAAVRGSSIFKSFQSSELVYMSFVLRPRILTKGQGDAPEFSQN